MRVLSLGGVAAVAVLAGIVQVAPGCGGGGGGGGGPCTIPGTLIALAVEGGVAPGTGGGTYAAIPDTVTAAAADGGWVAWLADVSGGTVTGGLFAARPDGSTRLVYAIGETLPESSPGTGTITGFQRIFVTSGGVFVALVTGTGPSEGVVTARIDGSGNVVEKHGVIWIGDTLPTSVGLAVPGALTDIDPTVMEISDTGETFFYGVGTGLTPVRGIYAVDRVGSAPVAWVATGDSMSGGGTCTGAFDGLGIATDSGVGIVAFSTGVSGGPGTKGIYAKDTYGTMVQVAYNGQTPADPGTRTFLDVFGGGPLIVSYLSGVAYVTWTGVLSGGSPDLGVFSKQVAPSLLATQTIVRPFGAATLAGGGALYDDCILLDCEHDPNRVTIQALVTGGTTDRLYLGSPGPGSVQEILREGGDAPGGTAHFTNTFPSLGTSYVHHADNLDSMAFTATLDDASTGVFWAVYGCGLFAVALEGDPAPSTGGGSFDAFGAPAVVTTATNVVVFRSAVVLGTAASGLFRQG
jgi:hypothetical protein